MAKKKKHVLGHIKHAKIKVRKKSPPAIRVQKSAKDYDRKALKHRDRLAQLQIKMIRNTMPS